MSCPYLMGRQIKMCGAFKAILVLNLEELESCCASNHYDACKIYQKYVKQGVKLPLKEYESSYQTPAA